MANLPKTTQSSSINKTLVLSFLFVALVPVLFNYFWSYSAAWDNAWREIEEKHKLLAENLSSTLSFFVQDNHSVIDSIKSQIESAERPMDKATLTKLLNDNLKHANGLIGIAMISTSGEIKASTYDPQDVTNSQPLLASAPAFFHQALNTPEGLTTNIIPHPVSGRPSINVVKICTRKDKTFLLIGEIKVSVIDKFRERVKFGKIGHSALVDGAGRTIAHPNPEWLIGEKDMSHLEIVKRLQRGEQGILTFDSPFYHSEMVSAYRLIPGTHWGVMVSQPMSEVDAQVNGLAASSILGSLVGFAITIIIAVWIARWITTPINRLASGAQRLTEKDFRGELVVPDTAPTEVQQLGAAFRQLLTGIRDSRDHILSLVSHSPIIFLVTDKDGMINYAAGKALQSTNISSEQIVGTNVMSLWPALGVDNIIEQVNQGKVVSTSISHANLELDVWFGPHVDENENIDSIIVVATDVSDSKRAQEFARLAEEFKDLNVKFLRVQEDERKSVSAQLHDDIGQHIVAIKLEIKNILRAGTDTKAVKASADHLKILSDKVYDAVRRNIFRLRPPILDEVGLVEALDELLKDWHTTNSEINYKFIHQGTVDDLDEIRFVSLYRIVQECLTNISKYAGASKVSVTLIRGDRNADLNLGDHVELRVKDNGSGFSVGEAQHRRYGLLTMKQRVETLGGHFSVNTTKGEGVEILCIVPMHNDDFTGAKHSPYERSQSI